ncbi:O-sialoglycoprotein endopeptidase [Aeropyrum pernix K1]|uniref:tRNA N6-adenosine threonylcarbamoyltransferase n=1 Tax=Aeropyrum pernix (strain ATCC 700893 / DSM 11879 / JCM 9820 / NBRC 100138 / K1) TaxID=272557 RepID=KAE1_AERPE|nr:KEOPS complex N(6)-L-threonylcarbamoyladenine synthase Kae1 [Aeropyrum pernix]Q9YCX7.1 RecName: Full=tRNA N6-adenosine threonylcarbamoyltransferase; AltName: Full=N6-L-threonylcarbamoyladenine synthase; Short=t(6)A synthase; AltName: Full=t(6)A37 threonylcarbamoyladenosine biosynthesis protein Kae1; AltName: Full=tRNA threonylcarbamoyladenosine biosynthesis protein Kae1 [Aeropyrum pernix K1]BAA80120.1 O-sialoglycoprotein endopeptidase [Aeropyrum pernix K1]
MPPKRDGEVLVLGIESTAHTFGVGIVSTRPPIVRADVRRRWTPREGGILPREVAEFFSLHAGEAVAEALGEAGVSIADVDAVAVALGPGMGPALRVGATVARALSAKYGKPLVPVNHAVAHVEAARFTTGLRDPVALYVAGGNTTVVSFVAGRYRTFGETLDIALGNLLDTFAREAGIAPPYVAGGLHAVDRCAEGGGFVEGIPYVVKGQDVSFSGILTAALRLLKRGARLSDVCYTLREVAFSSVVEVTERCLAHTGKRQATLTGGVAANRVLNEKMSLMAGLHGAVYRPVDVRLSGDNGVMIALTGLAAYLHGVIIDPGEAYIRQRWRIDEVDIPWYPWLPGDPPPG